VTWIFFRLIQYRRHRSASREKGTQAARDAQLMVRDGKQERVGVGHEERKLKSGSAKQ
jgi:hypothetical protein